MKFVVLQIFYFAFPLPLKLYSQRLQLHHYFSKGRNQYHYMFFSALHLYRFEKKFLTVKKPPVARQAAFPACTTVPSLELMPLHFSSVLFTEAIFSFVFSGVN